MTVQCQFSASTLRGPTTPLPGLGFRPFQNHHDAIRIGSHKEQLLSQTYNIVIQRRTIPPSSRERLRSVQCLAPFKRQISLNMHEEVQGLSSLLDADCTLESSELEAWLLQDMQALALDFCSILGHGHLNATLAVIDRTMCPRWHADHVTMRLLCTYFGAGTEYVENSHADRRPLQRLLFQDTEGYGIRDERAVQSALPGDVLYLKGHAFPGNEGCGAVHRSPKASAEAPRLVFTLDEAFPLPTEECRCGELH